MSEGQGRGCFASSPIGGACGSGGAARARVAVASCDAGSALPALQGGEGRGGTGCASLRGSSGSLIELSGRLSKTSNSCPISKNRGNHNRVIEIHKIPLFFSMLVDSIEISIEI